MSSTHGGYITLHRKIRDHWLWNDGHTFSKMEAWIDLIFDARWKKRAGSVTIGTRKIRCERGQTIRSCESWAMRWKWSKSRVYRFLMLLKERNAIRTESVTKTTRITIVNYDAYQIMRNDNGTISETQTRHIRRSKEERSKEERSKEERSKEERSKEERSKEESLTSPVFQQVINAYNEVCGKAGFATARLTKKRQEHIKARLQEKYFCENYQRLFEKVAASGFCRGENDRGFKVDLGWLVQNDDNYVKVLEGKYDDRKPKTKPLDSPRDKIMAGVR